MKVSCGGFAAPRDSGAADPLIKDEQSDQVSQCYATFTPQGSCATVPAKRCVLLESLET